MWGFEYGDASTVTVHVGGCARRSRRIPGSGAHLHGLGLRLQVRAVRDRMSSRRTARGLAPFAVGAFGIAVAVAVAAAGRMGVSSTVGLLLWTVGGAAGSTALAVALLWGLRRRPVTVQVTIASLAPVVAVAAGVAGGSLAMFISGHDLRTLVVILVGAGTVGMITALLFGSRISRSSAGLGELARRHW